MAGYGSQRRHRLNGAAGGLIQMQGWGESPPSLPHPRHNPCRASGAGGRRRRQRPGAAGAGLGYIRFRPLGGSIPAPHALGWDARA